jgi:hypothetical protein
MISRRHRTHWRILKLAISNATVAQIANKPWPTKGSTETSFDILKVGATDFDAAIVGISECILSFVAG